jgi:putative glutamine amidotransferase
MTPRPLIGVSTSELRVAAQAHPVANSEPRRRELALGISYLEAIERAGAMPVILAPLPADKTSDLLDRLSGICLSGGPDVDPAYYGGGRHAELGPTEPPLDRFEIELARGAQERGLPLLAICRGMQVLNVARGGTLIQHLPDRGRDVDHRQTAAADVPTHDVRIVRSSCVGRALGEATAEVNSFHHQGLDLLGDGLHAVAWSSDGVIEGVEAVDSGPFAVGVQWHAECLVERPEQARLFRAFVGAAERYGDSTATSWAA